MSHKQKKENDKKEQTGKAKVRWIVSIFVTTVLISGGISAISSIIFEHAGIIPAFFVLLFIVLIGIVFDIVGVAVTAADTKPFHSMASHKALGAREAILLLKNSEKVSSICNDVIGDICGVISGFASATLVLLLVAVIPAGNTEVGVFQIIFTAIISGLTVGGKAIGKIIAINQSTQIVHLAGIFIYYFKNFPKLFINRFKRNRRYRK